MRDSLSLRPAKSPRLPSHCPALPPLLSRPLYSVSNKQAYLYKEVYLTSSNHMRVKYTFLVCKIKVLVCQRQKYFSEVLRFGLQLQPEG